MRKMKRVVALGLTAVMVLGLFSGCGSSGSSSGKYQRLLQTSIPY